MSIKTSLTPLLTLALQRLGARNIRGMPKQYLKTGIPGRMDLTAEEFTKTGEAKQLPTTITTPADFKMSQKRLEDEMSDIIAI